jgi:pimeloyl-ACP methyl ester carboxylesterase
MNTLKHNYSLFADTLPLAVSDSGSGRPYLILHGGAGPNSMLGLAGALSNGGSSLVPTHPGFDGQPRPERFARIDDLVLAYLTLIQQLDLNDVVVVGNSLGGWIAAEMALRKSPRIAGIVLINAVGIDTGSPDKKIVNPMDVPPAERATLAFHNPERYGIAPSSPEALAVMIENQRTMRTYAGEGFMHDPTLRGRLAQSETPSLVVWGESDRIVDIEYGRLFADSIPRSRFEKIAEAGHFPHIEQLDNVVGLIAEFVGRL